LDDIWDLGADQVYYFLTAPLLYLLLRSKDKIAASCGDMVEVSLFFIQSEQVF